MSTVLPEGDGKRKRPSLGLARWHNSNLALEVGPRERVFRENVERVKMKKKDRF